MMPVEHKLSVHEDGRSREVLLVGTVTVGRSATCEISSPDPRLSRTHATFEVVDGQVIVRDLDSRNGTTVNGSKITEHHLRAGEKVEVGPFVIELKTPPVVAPAERRPHINTDDEATVMLGAHARAALASTPPSDTPGSVPPAAAPKSSNDSATRLIPRNKLPAAVASAAPVAPSARAESDTQRMPLAAAREAAPKIEPARPAPEAAVRPADPVRPTAPVQPAAPEAATARPAATELTFANSALLWIVPVVLISFLAGLVPDFAQPDERAPLLRAHYVSLATSAVDLAKTSREPSVPIDNVTAALRRQAGVTSARIIGANGRVMAPLDQAGTTVSPPNMTNTEPSIADAPNGAVEVQVPARTGDNVPVMIALTIDPERIHPAPQGSPLGTVLLLISLGAAWLVARRLTQITDTRLSRLGEEIELMTTRQITVGRDPFTLKGGQRILDAVTFALSAAGRIASEKGSAAAAADSASGDAPASASIDADSAFRIVSADRGCEALLGVNPLSAAGLHLIDALPDQAVSDEVMRLVTMATTAEPASGEAVSGDRGIRLGITVTKAADGRLAIRFKRL